MSAKVIELASRRKPAKPNVKLAVYELLAQINRLADGVPRSTASAIRAATSEVCGIVRDRFPD